MKIIKSLIGILFIVIFINCSGQKFDSEEWKQWEESEANPDLRWQMHDDLLDSYDLIGHNDREITELLGNPENVFKNEWHYYMGYTGTGINTGSLIITFKNGAVTDVRVRNG